MSKADPHSLISTLSSSERSKVTPKQFLELITEWDSQKLDLKDACATLSSTDTKLLSHHNEAENDYWDSKWTITNSVGNT